LDILHQVDESIKNEETKMANESYTAAIEVAKSPKEVFNRISEVSKWWSKDYEGSSKKLNDEFVIHHIGRHYSKQKLVEIIPDKKVVWLVTESKLNWLEKDKHEWTNTKMVFELTTKGNKTVLHFTHEGLVPGKECYARCEQGWNMIIRQWLFNFITDDNWRHPVAKSAFVYVTYIRTTPEKLWSALTDVEIMKQYWFGVRCESRWTEGSTWKLAYPDGRITDAGEIVEAEPPRRLVIRWQHQDKPDLKAEGESYCMMELEQSGSAVKLSITHTIAREPSKFIAAVSAAWPMVISNLKSLLETGSIVLREPFPIESTHSKKE